MCLDQATLHKRPVSDVLARKRHKKIFSGFTASLVPWGAVVFPFTFLEGVACTLKQGIWCGNKSFSDLPQKVAFSSQANTLTRWTACSWDAGARVSCLKVIKTLGLSFYLWKKNPGGRCLSALLLTCAMRVNLPESSLQHRWRRKQLGWPYEIYLYVAIAVEFFVRMSEYLTDFMKGEPAPWMETRVHCRFVGYLPGLQLPSQKYLGLQASYHLTGMLHRWAAPNSIRSPYLGIQIPHRGFYLGVLFPFQDRRTKAECYSEQWLLNCPFISGEAVSGRPNLAWCRWVLPGPAGWCEYSSLWKTAA